MIASNDPRAAVNRKRFWGAKVAVSWISIGPLVLLLTCAIFGAVFALIGALASLQSLYDLGSSMAAYGAAGFFGWMLLTGTVTRFLNQIARSSDQHQTAKETGE